MREILHNLENRMQKAKQNIEGIAQAMKVSPTTVQRRWEPRGGMGGAFRRRGDTSAVVHPLRPQLALRCSAQGAGRRPQRPRPLRGSRARAALRAGRQLRGRKRGSTRLPHAPAPSQDWSANPMFERKDNKKEALLDLDGRLTNLNKRYTAVKEAGVKIQAMVAVSPLDGGLGFP